MSSARGWPIKVGRGGGGGSALGGAREGEARSSGGGAEERKREGGGGGAPTRCRAAVGHGMASKQGRLGRLTDGVLATVRAAVV
jgi:hypothetical protein